MQNNTLGLVLLCLELLNSFGRMLKFDFVKKLLAKQSKKILAFDWPVSFVTSLEGKQIQFLQSAVSALPLVDDCIALAEF